MADPDPPHRHKERQQQAVQTRFCLDPTGFQVPASTFAVLEGCLDTHAPGIFAYPPFAGFVIRNEHPALLTLRHPTRAHIGFKRILLPDFGPAIPWLSCFMHKCIKPAPRAPALAHLAPTGVLLAQAQEIVPAAITADLHQGEPCSPSIGDQGAVSPLQMWDDLIEQTRHNAPLWLLPLLLSWHHGPG